TVAAACACSHPAAGPASPGAERAFGTRIGVAAEHVPPAAPSAGRQAARRRTAAPRGSSTAAARGGRRRWRRRRRRELAAAAASLAARGGLVRFLDQRAIALLIERAPRLFGGNGGELFVIVPRRLALLRRLHLEQVHRVDLAAIDAHAALAHQFVVGR